MTIELFVFDSRPELIRSVSTGPDGSRADAVVVDWERSGKPQRQRDAVEILGFDTQLAPTAPADLTAVVNVATAPVICRIDAWDHHGPADLERAIESGASEVIVPMVRTTREIDAALAQASGRVGVGVMLETTDAVEIADEIASRPIARAYLGLVDLAIERRTPDIFTPIADGTLDHVAEACSHLPFGFAGLTIPGRGAPVPTVELAESMLRVGASFTFLRRSFLRDACDDLAGGLAGIRTMLGALDLATVERGVG